jgi:antitoxin PrlF
MQESTVTTKGQTTLPKDVRIALQLHPGDRIRYMILDGGEVRLVRSRPVLQLAGLLKHRTDRRASLDDMDEAIARGAVDK